MIKKRDEEEAEWVMRTYCLSDCEKNLLLLGIATYDRERERVIVPGHGMPFPRESIR